jgi:hypothetical protein
MRKYLFRYHEMMMVTTCWPLLDINCPPLTFQSPLTPSHPLGPYYITTTTTTIFVFLIRNSTFITDASFPNLYFSQILADFRFIFRWIASGICFSLGHSNHTVGNKSFASGRRKHVFFLNTNNWAHRQDIKVLLMALNFTFVLVLWRTLSTNYLHNFVFSVHLNFSYFSLANFWRKIVDSRQQEVFFKFLWKNPQRLHICCASNKIGMKEVTAHFGDHFFSLH